MIFQAITPEQFGDLMNELAEIKSGVIGLNSERNDNWVRSKTIKQKFGISDQTLQYYRDRKFIEFAMVGSTYYYNLDSFLKQLESNKSPMQVKAKVI
jgi:hypothetical protein